MGEEGTSLKSYWPNMVVRRCKNMKSIGVDQFHSDCRSKEKERTGLNQLAFPVTNSVDLQIFVGTWNVGGKSPQVELNLNDWLRTNSPADIYVLGFQEIVPLTAGNVLGFGDGAAATKWLCSIHKALNDQHELILSDSFSSFRANSSSKVQCFPSPVPQQHCAMVQNRHPYRMAAARQMVGIFLCMWVREDMYRHISSLSISRVGTGIMGCLGNKGSVSISMTLHETSFCFVCTHLASGEKEGDAMRRNTDVMAIFKRTGFSKSCRILGKSDPPASILDHDNIIWLGDLNYRLASISGDTYDLLERKNWQALFLKDQLRIEQNAGRVFEGWEEGEISFAPTYKYFLNSDQYMYQTSTTKKKRRTPAWYAFLYPLEGNPVTMCDRILWKGKGLEQMIYSRGESRFSDHRPVVSLFAVQVNLPGVT